MNKRPNVGAREERVNISKAILLFPPLDPQQDRKQTWLDFCREHRTTEEQKKVEAIIALMNTRRL